MTVACAPRSVVVLAGPPGAGKTTVSRLAHDRNRVVLDGIVGPWNLDLVTDEAAAAGAEVHYAVLRPALDVAVSRATSRAGEERVPCHPALTDDEPVRKLWHEFDGLGDYERHVIDSTGLDPAQTASTVCALLDAGKLRVL